VYFFYYFPVGLDIKVRKTPVITIFLSLMCLISFVAYRYIPQTGTFNLYNLVFQPAYPNLATAFAHVFLHGSWMHIIGNIVYLAIFGRAIEDRLGAGRFFILFALSAMAGAWTHMVFTLFLAPEYIGYGVIGASGATSGLLGAYVVRFYYSRIRIAYWIFMPLQGVNRAGRKYVPGILAIAFWFVYQGVYTVMQFGAGYMHVAYSVHLGGFVCGMLLALVFGSKLSARADRRLQKAREHVADANWFGAQGEYINYLDLMPSAAGIHSEAARAFLCTGEKGRARYHYVESITSFMENGERGEAEEVFGAAMRSITGFTMEEKIHLKIVFGMERSLKFNAALSGYRNFIERYTRSTEAPFVLLRMAGLQERRFGKPDEAYDCYTRLIAEYPEDSWADFARSEVERLGVRREDGGEGGNILSRHYKLS
jgi:membrane associated rhomboid family serine protease